MTNDLSRNRGRRDCLPISANLPQIGARVARADGCLVYLAEQHGFDIVFTIDRRDFSIYRLSSGRALQIVPS